MDLLFLNSTDDSDFLTELQDSAKYRGYLQTMSHFSGYSWRNIFLIYKQMPHATKLADFKGWKEQYGRNIMQGAKRDKPILLNHRKPSKKTKLIVSVRFYTTIFI